MENHIFNGKIVELEDGEEAVSYRLTVSYTHLTLPTTSRV